MARPYVILDVFTDRALAGNPLAVVLDSAGLDDAAMQAVAREFNLSETVFVRPPENPAHRASLRIYTPSRELPFAGHPTVGTAALLATIDAAAGDHDVTFVLEERIGPVPCGIRLTAEGPPHATFTVPRLPEPAGDAPSVADLAVLLGLEPEEIGFGHHRPSRWAAAMAFTFIPVKGLESIRRCRFDPVVAERVLAPLGAMQVYVYCAETERETSAFHARMFDAGFGIGEDPATGSAAATFAGLYVATERPDDGDWMVLIEQGFEMGRPSLIELGVSVTGGKLVSARIGGHAVIVAEGSLRI